MRPMNHVAVNISESGKRKLMKLSLRNVSVILVDLQ